MRLEKTEELFVEGLFKQSIERKKINAVEIENIIKLTGDASTRRYYRIFTKGKSFIVCIDGPLDSNSKRFPFSIVQNSFHENKVRVPSIHDEIGESGYLLEEDFGDKTLLAELAAITNVDEEYLWYKKSIDELLKIHEIKKHRYKDEIFVQKSFTTAKLMEEVTLTNTFFLQYLGGVYVENEKASILKSFEDICDKINTQEYVICHRDFHSRNIMCMDQKVGIIDFQDARLGIPQYDLCSLLEDCYYEIHDKVKEKLIQYYYENSPSKKSMGLDQFQYFYDLMALQRIYKAIGSFTFIYYNRGDDRYLKYVGRSFENMKKILLGHNEFKDLRIQLARLYYES